MRRCRGLEYLCAPRFRRRRPAGDVLRLTARHRHAGLPSPVLFTDSTSRDRIGTQSLVGAYQTVDRQARRIWKPTGSRRGADQTLGSNAAGGSCRTEAPAEPVKIGYLMDFLLSDDFPSTTATTSRSRSAWSSRRPMAGGNHRSSGRGHLPRGERPAEGLSEGGHRRLPRNWSTKAFGALSDDKPRRQGRAACF